MAKRTKKRRAGVEWLDASATLAEKGYEKCGICRRDMRDKDAHEAAHASGKIGEDGRRTDRSKAEAEAWASRWNGRGEAKGRVFAAKAAKAKPAKAKRRKAKKAA